MKYIVFIITIILLCVFLYSSNKHEHFADPVPNLIYNANFSYSDGTSYKPYEKNTKKLIFNLVGTPPIYKGPMLVAGLWEACNTLYINVRALEKNSNTMKNKLSVLGSSSEHFQDSSTNILDNPEISLKCYNNKAIKTKDDTGFDWKSVTNAFPAIKSSKDNYQLVPILWKIANNLCVKITNLQEDFNNMNDKIDQMK